MQKSCAVPMCNNTLTASKSSSILFHRFPSDDKILKKWLNFCNDLEDEVSDYKNAVICSKHFNEDNYDLKSTTEV